MKSVAKGSKKNCNFCEDCGNKLSNGINTNKFNKNNNEKTIKIILWIFLFPIMLCIYIWKNERINQKYKIPIIIGIIIIAIVFVTISSASEEQLIKDTINKCYSEETYNKLDELYGIVNLDGNFESDMECSNLKLKDTDYNEIVITEKEEKLLSIQIKDGQEYKYIYNVDKSYDVYDHKTLEIKEKADEKLKAERERHEKEEKKASAKAKRLKKFTDIGLNEKNAEEAFEILKKCGIYNISELKKGTKTENVSSYTTTYTNSDYDSYSLVIFIVEERLYAINSGSLTIYNRSQKIQKNINDYILSTSEKNKLQTFAKEYVKQNLKAPSTAEFSGSFLSPFDGWEMQQSGTTYKVKSYVDSQNSFGAMVRTQFYLELKFGGNGNLKVTKFQTS